VRDEAGVEVVVTGLGAVTPFGPGADRLWRALLAGRDAFGPIDLFSTEGHRTTVAAQVRELPEAGPRRLEARLLSRPDVMALAACGEALGQAGLLGPAGEAADPGLGLCLGTAAGGILGLEDFFRARAQGRAYDAAALLTSFALSAPATNLAREFRLAGPRATLATVCSSSGAAMAQALDMLRAGEVSRVLVVGAESLSRVTHAGFNCLRSVDPERCRPFDLDRRGLVLGEGAGALVLETAEAAAARGARVLARFAGYGFTTDTHHFTAPDPEGAAVAATLGEALADAGVGAAEVGYVNAHGTGTPLNDTAECKGIARALAEAPDLAVSSSKSMIGHLLGAASAVEAVITVMALRAGLAPPTANLATPCPECAGLDLVPGAPRATSGRVAVSNSLAFGGSNVSLVFTSPDRSRPKRPAEPGPGPDDRAVITGLGLVTPCGIGREALAKALAEGRDGLASLGTFGPAWEGRIGGLVDLAAVRARLAPARRRHLNRVGTFLEVAATEALADADLADQADTLTMAFGSAFGCSGSVNEFYARMLAEGPTLAPPLSFMLSVTNAPAALTAQHLGIRHPVWVYVADEASFDLTLASAVRLVRSGRADRVLVTAADELGDAILAIHQALGFCDAPGNLVLGEGAVCLVVESQASARARGARPYAAVAATATVQDVVAGPCDFCADPGRLATPAAACLARLADPRAAVTLAGPGNGLAACEATARAALAELAGPWPGLAPTTPRRLWGESGLTSGLALAGGLLAPTAPHCLSLTNARGGLCSAVLLDLDPARGTRG
jgi:3-oxoacyl-[acyl-carrier-protein] synthase II